MRVSTKSWHYKFLKFIYVSNNFEHKDIEFYFDYELRKMTKCDYILSVIKNIFWTAFATAVVLACIVALIMSAVALLPLLVIAFIIGVCIAISNTYNKYNAKCAKIKMTDEET
jgi:hypothetical protein